jgi:hypothetical protein
MRRRFTAAMSIGLVVGCLGKTVAWAQDTRGNTPREPATQIREIDEQFRVAKLRNDVQSLERILDESFVEMNQNGNSRTKNETIELFQSFRIQSLTTDEALVRVSGNAALVTGSQTELNSTGTDRMLFTRVYVRTGGGWRLIASSQFRNPHFGNVATR